MNKINRTYFLSGKKRFPIIAIEGIDGSGKSTVAHALAKRINGVCLHTPPDDYLILKKRFERDPNLVLSRFLFYTCGLVESWKIAKKIISSRPVVFDRYTLSTLLYHKELLKTSKSYPDIDSVATIVFPPEADVNIIINTPEEIIKERISRRKNIFDNHLENNRGFQKKVLERFLKSGADIIEAGNKGINELVDECILIIDKCLNTNFINKSTKEATV